NGGIRVRRRGSRRPAHGARRGRLRGEPPRRAGDMTVQPLSTETAELDARLQLALGWTFRDPSLLELALTHRSYCAARGIDAAKERLEFLGDSVLGFVVTTYVFEEFPHLPEGELAKLRAVVVSSETLARLARDIGLGAALRLGKGENASGGRAKTSILADAI